MTNDIPHWQRVLAIMLCEHVLSVPENNRTVDPKLVLAALQGGHLWALEYEYAEITETPKSVAEETCDILDMWMVIERAFAELPEEDQAEVREAAYPEVVNFRGFDGNQDAHFGVARFLIRVLGRYDEYQDRDLNSHSPTSLLGYRHIYPRYKRILFDRHNFTPSKEQLIEVLRWEDPDAPDN